MTQAQYARAANLTRARVSQLVKAGMPLDSPEVADAWRGISARKRASNNPYQQVKPQESTKRNEQVEQRQDNGKCDPVRVEHVEQKRTNPIDSIEIHSVSDDSPQGAYERQKQIERAAYGLAVRALKSSSYDAPRMVAIHSQAAKNLTQAREEVLKLNQLEQSLVTAEWVKEIMLQHDGAVALLIRSLPKEISRRSLPKTTEALERELERWVQEIALPTIYNSTPWK